MLTSSEAGGNATLSTPYLTQTRAFYVTGRVDTVYGRQHARTQADTDDAVDARSRMLVQHFSVTTRNAQAVNGVVKASTP